MLQVSKNIECLIHRAEDPPEMDIICIHYHVLVEPVEGISTLKIIQH